MSAQSSFDNHGALTPKLEIVALLDDTVASLTEADLDAELVPTDLPPADRLAAAFLGDETVRESELPGPMDPIGQLV